MNKEIRTQWLAALDAATWDETSPIAGIGTSCFLETIAKLNDEGTYFEAIANMLHERS